MAKRTDILSKDERSRLMSRIRSRGNLSTELALARLFRENRIRGWRRHVGIPLKSDRRSKRPIRPDFVFSKARLVVFVDGCFWHGCPLHSTSPKANARFWKDKIAGNRRRDLSSNRALRSRGWKVFRIWEHELAGIKTPSGRLGRMLQRISASLEMDAGTDG